MSRMIMAVVNVAIEGQQDRPCDSSGDTMLSNLFQVHSINCRFIFLEETKTRTGFSQSKISVCAFVYTLVIFNISESCQCKFPVRTYFRFKFNKVQINCGQ